MRNRKLLSILFVAVFVTLSAGYANAQSSKFIGYYMHTQSIDEGRNSLDLIFDLKAKGVAVYRNQQGDNETQKRTGTWAYNAKSKLITVTLPPVKKNPTQGQEVKLTFVFKAVGENLELVKDLPYNDGVGNLYERQ